jgi:parvulin-like peptidyl-prolyl isomerase
MNLALQIGDSQIPVERVLQQLHESQLLPQLLREILIDETIDRVAREYDIDLTPSEEEFQRLSAQVGTIAPFQGMSPEQLEAITARTLKAYKFKQAGWGHKVSSYFETVRDRLDRVAYSLLLVEDGSIAQELFFRVQSAENSFAEIALTYSQHDTAQRGGSIGPMLLSEVNPAIASVLNQLQPGELSTLFQLDRFYGFIRLNELIKAELTENMHQSLLDELFENWIQTQLATEIGANAEISLTTLAPDAKLAAVAVGGGGSTATTATATATNRATTPFDPFAPDFAYRETNLAEDAGDSLPPTTPEVTVVTEPEERDLAVTTGFFFPDSPEDK